MPFVENVSRDAIEKGLHHGFNYDKDLLIQITDPDSEFPIPKYEFKNVVQFKFFDSEEEDGPTDQQALEISTQILLAFNRGQNILVHCQAGLCRSGAVAEAAIMLGFTEVHKRRWPNRRLGKQLCKWLHLPQMTERDYEEVFENS